MFLLKYAKEVIYYTILSYFLVTKMKKPQAIASRYLLHLSQRETFPYFIEEFGLKILVHEGVFSPKYFNGYKTFTRNFPKLNGKEVLEIGCGSGITGLYLAKNGAKKVVLVDINNNAIENTKENVKINKIGNVDVRHSDIFSGIRENENFDIVYWNFPFIPIDANYEFRSSLERSLFDPNYNLLERFLKETPTYLRQNGKLLIGWGESDNHYFGDSRRLLEVASSLDYKIKLIS